MVERSEPRQPAGQDVENGHTRVYRFACSFSYERRGDRTRRDAARREYTLIFAAYRAAYTRPPEDTSAATSRRSAGGSAKSETGFTD